MTTTNTYLSLVVMARSGQNSTYLTGVRVEDSIVSVNARRLRRRHIVPGHSHSPVHGIYGHAIVGAVHFLPLVHGPHANHHPNILDGRSRELCVLLKTQKSYH